MFVTKEYVAAQYANYVKSHSPVILLRPDETKEDNGFSWIKAKNILGVFTHSEMVSQINIWVSAGLDMRCNPYNSKTFETGGRKHYVLVVQEYEGDDISTNQTPCPLSLMLFGTLVSGYTYAFDNEELRDTYVSYINSHRTIEEHPICCLCGMVCDCPYGHNSNPITCQFNRRNICCSKCNAEKVIPARLKGMSYERCKKQSPFNKKTREETPDEKERREKAENELLAGGGAVSQPKEKKVKTKEQEKKEKVKQQNKANEEEKKLKEKQEREQAIAYEKRLEQQKKRQREIEMKKRKALVARISK